MSCFDKQFLIFPAKRKRPANIQNVLIRLYDHVHDHAVVFMRHFSCDLISHQAQQHDSHGNIRDHPDHLVSFDSGHHRVLYCPRLLQAFDPGLKFVFRYVAAEASAIQPCTASGIGFDVVIASSDSAAA